MHLPLSTSLLPRVFFAILRAQLPSDYTILKAHCILMAIVTQTGQEVLMTENLPPATAFISVPALFSRLLRSRQLWLGLVLRLSIGPWHLRLLKCIGSACYSRSFRFLFFPLLACGLIILVLSHSLPILSFMPAPNILKWITTSSEKKFSTRISLLSISQLIINLQISSPKACLPLVFSFCKTS
jgi:hypothetical protein